MNFDKKISELKLNDNTIKVLNDNNIFTLEDVWLYKRTELKKLGIPDSQINQIRITLQLMGKDLNKKTYRNS